MDGSANPYLMQAGVAAAGLDGIGNQRDPGEPLHIDMYAHGHTVKSAERLPANLLDALRLFEKSEVLREHLGGELVDSYTKLKMVQWNEYTSHLSDWERKTTLDC